MLNFFKIYRSPLKYLVRLVIGLEFNGKRGDRQKLIDFNYFYLDKLL